MIEPNIQNFIKQRKLALKFEYLNSPNYILEHYRSEIEAIEEYDGRQLLEMLQNADDASAEATFSKVSIQLKNNQLVIANTGHEFTQDGLESILFRNISPKYKERSVIGNKGLGFRAILSWVKKVSIYSGDLQVAFSEQNSCDFLDALIKKEPSIRTLIENKNKGFDYTIATLRIPEIIETKPKSLPKGYDTYVVLDLKENVVSDVINQIENSVDLKSLIFVNHLVEIDININGNNRILKANRAKNNSIHLFEKINTKTTTEKWHIHSLEGDIEKIVKDKTEKYYYNLSVAWQDELTDYNESLYSYFKTTVSFPFPGLIHGTFELTPDRNRLLNNSSFNTELIKEIPKLLCQASEKIALQNKEEVNFKALSFLDIKFDALDYQFSSKQFKEEFIKHLQTYNILPTIANTYINFEKEPIIYENGIFSEILNPKYFPDLLINNKNEDFDHTLDGTLKYSTCSIESLFENITKDRSYYDLDSYSELTIAISELSDFEIPESGSSLFYNNLNELLYFEKKIFIPDNHDFINSIKDIAIQVLDIKFYENLKTKWLNNFEDEDFQDFLEKYNLSTFELDEVIELLIENYSTKKNKDSVIELNKRLFELFKRYHQNLGVNWKGNPVPLITLKTTLADASKLYFTKEYDEELIHQLYSYDKDKLIANIQDFKIDLSEKSKWKKYLKWLGVEVLPRKFHETISDNDYAEYCLRKFDFKLNIGDRKFKSYEEFLSRFKVFGEVEAFSIDDIDNLILNNKQEIILTWIFNDSEIKDLIEKNIEPISSYIYVDFKHAKVYQIIRSNYLKNYLKWKLNTIPWILTENKTKKTPKECTTSITITDDFNDILDKPNINYQFELFKKYNIIKSKIQYLLNLIGVHESISTLSTNSLYNILLKLPKIDNEGKKVKTIYREIATNYEVKSLDKNDENYIDYKENGEIFCNDPENVERYLPINKVNYIDNKRYGNSIINLFNKASIDRRKGKSKIEQLFNIKPLEKLKINTKSEPILHFLNLEFEKEIQQFKPYVYVFRQDYDKNGSDRNIIKNTKFKLVNSLTVQVKTKEITKDAVLGDYEYIYNRNKNEVLIVCPEHISSIAESKVDVMFCSAIAEAFSSLLDVEQQRNQLRELYSKNLTGRNQLLSEELDDTNTERLQKAKESLNIISNQKLEFWIAFFRCFPSKKTNNLNTDKQLLIELERLFNDEEYMFIKSIVDKINYENLNNKGSLKLIVSLMIKFNISLEELNKFIYPIISLKLLCTNYLIDLKEKTKQEFKKRLYIKGKTDKNIRTKFLSLLEDYDHLVITEDYTELEYKKALEKFFQKHLEEVFSINLNNITSIDEIETEEIRKLNKSILLEKTGFNNQQYAYYRENKPEIESLLYFESEIDDLAISFGKFIEDLKIKTNSDASKFSNNFKLKGKDVYFDTYEDLLGTLSNTWSNNALIGCTFDSISTSKGEQKKQSKKEGAKGKGKRKNYRNQNHIGFIAEYVVWKYLELKLAKKGSTEWVSEYAREAGVNPEGKDGLGFDLKYIPKNAKTFRYVEVKAIGWDNSFNISSNEIKEAEKLKKKHKIFLVSNVDDIENMMIKEISGLFTYDKGRNFYDNNKFLVLNDNFIIKYDVKEND